MPGRRVTNSLARDSLRKLSATSQHKELIALRLAYSEDAKLLSGYINKLVNVDRIYPRHLPTQASGRWRTLDPPITNWPRACINPACQDRIYEGILQSYAAQHNINISKADNITANIEHEWTDVCWSVRDILLPDPEYILVTWDHDNIEGKIHDLIVNDKEALQAHIEGYDLHTITCCNIFGYDMPANLKNPHTSTEDILWRTRYNWQGKDTKQRVLAKNFSHGSKYTKTWRFVYRIEGIEKYGVERSHLAQLAKRYIASKGEAWKHKINIMDGIKRDREARSLYGFRRVFFDSSEATGREGFSHMISSTVTDYNNDTLILLRQWLGKDERFMHNAHDGDKIAIKRSVIEQGTHYLGEGETAIAHLTSALKAIIERPIEYDGRSLIMTAGIKVYA